MSDSNYLFQAIVVQQVGQIPGHSFHCGRGAILQGMVAMSAGIPTIYPVVFVEFMQKRKPLLMAGSPAVQHDDRGAFTGNLDMDFDAVVGREVRHGC